MIIAPLLQLVEENELTLLKKDITFGGYHFTPITAMINSYNKVFGVGIEIANVLQL